MLSLIKGIGNVLGLRRSKRRSLVQTQQQSKSVRFSGELEEEEKEVKEAFVVDDEELQESAVENYDNLTEQRQQQQQSSPSLDLSTTNCSEDSTTVNDESLKAIDYLEQLSSDLYPSLELQNQGVRHVTSNFDRLPYQGAHWLLQQQHIDEDQRLANTQLLQAEQSAEEDRLFRDELDPQVLLQRKTKELLEEYYDNAPSTEKEAEVQAALTIQRVLKGHCVRRRLCKQRKAIIVIQAHVRGYQTRRRLTLQKRLKCQNTNATDPAELNSAPHKDNLFVARLIQPSSSEYDLCTCCCRGSEIVEYAASQDGDGFCDSCLLEAFQIDNSADFDALTGQRFRDRTSDTFKHRAAASNSAVNPESGGVGEQQDEDATKPQDQADVTDRLQNSIIEEQETETDSKEADATAISHDGLVEKRQPTNDERDAAATRIQARFKGYRTRKEFGKLSSHKSNEHDGGEDQVDDLTAA